LLINYCLVENGSLLRTAASYVPNKTQIRLIN